MKINKKVRSVLLIVAFFVLVIPYRLAQHPFEQKVQVLNPIQNTPGLELPKDNRAELIDSYYASHDMPLAGYGKKLVEEADKNGIDWRLLAAISVKEQSGGIVLPYNCPGGSKNYNAWGWGSGSICFTSFDEAIEVVSQNLGGNNPRTHEYYKGSTFEKLHSYNGTVDSEYPKKVMQIMDSIR